MLCMSKYGCVGFSAPSSKSVTKRLNCHYCFMVPPLSLIHNENNVFTAALMFFLLSRSLSLSSSSGIATQFERLSKMPVSASTVCVCVHTLHTSTACLCTSLHPCNCCTSLCVNCIFPLMNTCPAAVTANECVSVPPVPCINQLPLGHTVQISLLVSAKEELISLNLVPMRLIRWW